MRTPGRSLFLGTGPVFSRNIPAKNFQIGLALAKPLCYDVKSGKFERQETVQMHEKVKQEGK